MCHNHYADGDIDASADRRQTNAELFKVNIMLTAVKLPSNFTIQSGRIFKKLNSKAGGWELFSNGAFQVSSAYMCHGSKEVFLTVRFEDADGNHTDEITLSQTDLVRSGNGLLRLVPSWFVFYTPRLADQVDFIRSAINLQRADLPIRTVFRVGPGYHIAPDGKTLFYVLGDQVIHAPKCTELVIDSCLHLRKYRPGKPSEGIRWVRRFCGQGPPQAAQFVATLMAFVRPLLELRGISSTFAIYVVGESGTGKSENAKLLCSIFQEQPGATLSSDKADIFRLMAAYRDFPFLVDDLNTSKTRAAGKKKERLSELIGQLSSEGALMIRGERFDVHQTALVVTAEALPKGLSTLNRCAVVQYVGQFDPDVLKGLQDNKNRYIDFLVDFIGWICAKFDFLAEKVRTWDFRGLRTGTEKPEAFVGYQRVMRTYETLLVTLEIFLLYLSDSFSLPREDWQSWERLLREGINQSVFVDTLPRLRKENSEQGRAYVDAILDIFSSEDQYRKEVKLVAKSYERFQQWNRQCGQFYYGRKLFFRNGNYYCCRGDDLVEYLSDFWNEKISYSISKKAVSAQLDYHGLLQKRGGELSYPVAGGGKTRYYHLRADVLEQLLKERRDMLLGSLLQNDPPGG